MPGELTPLEQHLLKLGKVSHNFQLVEGIVGSIVSSLIGPDQTIGQMIAAQMSFTRLCDLCAALVRYRLGADHELTTRVSHFLSRCNQVEASRNSLLHSLTLSSVDDESDLSRMKATIRRNGGFEHKHVEDASSEM